MRPLYLNPRDEPRVCLSMESLQETCTSLEEESAKNQAVKRKTERQTETEKSR